MLIDVGPEKEAINRAKHKLSLWHAEEFSDHALVLPTYPGSDDVRYKLIDRTSLGLLAAIVTPRDGKMRVISLRRVNRKERKQYEAAQIRHA